MGIPTKYNVGDTVYFIWYATDEYYDEENDDYYLEETPYEILKGEIVQICTNYKNEVDCYKLYVKEYSNYNWAKEVFSNVEDARKAMKKEK